MQNGFMRVTALALGIAGALTLGNAHASGFQIRENSVKNMGRAFSGMAVYNNDASVVTNNPAAMSSFDKSTVQTDISVINLTADFEGSGKTALGTPLTGTNGGDPGDPTAVPALSAVFPMSGALDNLTFGVMVDAPFGLKTEYDRDFVGRYNAVTSDVKIVDLSLSASLAITDRFSIGAGLILERADVTLTNAVDYGSAICAQSGNLANCFNPAYPFRPQNNDGFVDVSGNDTSLGWRVGMQWKPTDRLTIGASHRSEVDHDLKGTADFTAPAAVAAVLGARVADANITAPLTTPSISTISVRYDFSDAFRMMADYQATDWHSLEAVRIFREGGGVLGNEPFNWKDTDFFSVGAEFDLSPALTLRGGVARDESPTNDEARTPRLPDNDRMLYSIGATWHMSDALSFDAAYTRITIDDPTINGIHSSSGSTLNGKYSGHADLFGVAAQFKF
ncbi:OmpP1/FadL family transporter [Lysobacter xanthus]